MAKEIYLTPAEVVVRSFGGIIKTAKALGLPKQTVAYWFDPKKRRKHFGLIPAPLQKNIYLAAKEQNIHLSAKDLILGRRIEVKNG